MTSDPAKLYIAVRADLPPGLQAAQAVHAAFAFSLRFPRLTDEWFSYSNFLVVVSVPNEPTLADLASDALLGRIGRVIVREPDLDNEMTAVALTPGDGARRLCANLPLALKERVPL